MIKNINKIFLASLLCFSTFLYAKNPSIISIGGSMSETICALGHEKDLKAVDTSSIYPLSLKKIKKIGYWLQVPKEGILSLSPKIIIASELAKPKKTINSFKKFGIKTYIISDKPSLKSAKEKIRKIAEILHEEKQANEILKKMDKKIFLVKNAIINKNKNKNKNTKPKVLFLFSIGAGQNLGAGKGTKVGKMINLAGGVNALKTQNFVKVSPESILKINPDIIIFSSNHGKENLSTKYNNKNLSLTNAGKNKKFFTMNMLLISGFSVRTANALEDLSCMFYKNSFGYCK